VAAILGFALVVDAPLEAPANPGLSPNPAKAPWYFMGFQELLVHLHPLVAVLLIPLAGVVLLLRLPHFHGGSATEGVWFLSSRGRRTAALGAAGGAVATLAGILLDEYVLDLPGWMPGLPALVTAGLRRSHHAALAWRCRMAGRGVHRREAGRRLHGGRGGAGADDR
jgi:hypothetical protein